eukprot:COSAG06_NODE_62710_length_264_cov_0.630303_1_plen_84_part_01
MDGLASAPKPTTTTAGTKAPIAAGTKARLAKFRAAARRAGASTENIGSADVVASQGGEQKRRMHVHAELQQLKITLAQDSVPLY